MPSLDVILSTIQNGVTAMNNLVKTVATVFPQTTGASTSAAAGSATLPANPVGFITVGSSGTTIKIPYYL